MDDFGIREVDETTEDARRLEETDRAETEALLEDVIVWHSEDGAHAVTLALTQSPAAGR